MAGSPFTRGPAYAQLIAEAINGEVEPGSHHAALLEECDPLRPWDAHLRKRQQQPAPAPQPAVDADARATANAQPALPLAPTS